MNNMRAFLRQHRVAVLIATLLAFIAGVFLLPPIAQDQGYHDFADKRAWLGIPNFGDVMSNIPFLFMGLIGVFSLCHRGEFRGRLIWKTFFAGVFLTGFGSAYYHLAPDNHTLVWDRLPMTIAFMSLFSLMIMERISSRAGVLLFPAFLAAGFSSVLYWDYTEGLGHGDLRPYALVQFLPMVGILMILALFPASWSHSRNLLIAFGWYALAKLLEHSDAGVFALSGNAVSGHTLKHLAAATGIWWMIKYAKGQEK